MKKLPKLYKNTTASSPNKKYFYSKDENVVQEKVSNRDFVSREVPLTSEVSKTLNSLFQKNAQVYTKLVEIRTKENRYLTRLALKTDNAVVTIDNEKILISDIIDIQIK